MCSSNSHSKKLMMDDIWLCVDLILRRWAWRKIGVSFPSIGNLSSTNYIFLTLLTNLYNMNAQTCSNVLKHIKQCSHAVYSKGNHPSMDVLKNNRTFETRHSVDLTLYSCCPPSCLPPPAEPSQGQGRTDDRHEHQVIPGVGDGGAPALPGQLPGQAGGPGQISGEGIHTLPRAVTVCQCINPLTPKLALLCLYFI